MNTNTNNDAKMWEIYSHKEDYRISFLEDAQLWFFRNGYITESEELGNFIDSLDQNSSDSINYNVNNAEMWEIYSYKEHYEKSLLKKTELWLLRNGYIDECIELGCYIDSLEQDMSDDYYEPENNVNALDEDEDEDQYITKNNRIYPGSKSKKWTNYLKYICYFAWFFTIALNIFLGALASLIIDRHYLVIGIILGAVLGFIEGFMAIALFMTFITMCENIATTTDNTAKILMGIDELKDYYDISD